MTSEVRPCCPGDSGIESIEADEPLVRRFIVENYGKISVVLGVGAASGLANFEHGVDAVFTAGLKQAGYSSVSGVFLLSIYNFLEKRVSTLPAELIPIVLPTLTTIALNFGVHCLKGTAEPVLSTMPSALIALVGFPVWHFRTRLIQLQSGFEVDFDESDVRFG